MSVGRRVLSHKAEDFGRRRQDGREGDGGQRAGVEQELRGRREEHVGMDQLRVQIRIITRGRLR